MECELTALHTRSLENPTKNLSPLESRSGGRRSVDRRDRGPGRYHQLRVTSALAGLFLLVAVTGPARGAASAPGAQPPWGAAVALDAGPSGDAGPRADSGSVLTTFRVGPGTPVGGSQWTVSGDGLRVSVGAPIEGPGGATIGFHVLGGGRGATVSSLPWRVTHSGMVPETDNAPLFVAALYASDSNAHGGAGSPIGSAPGYIDDLGKFGLGRGPGWVAVDPTTGNYLLLRVTSSQVGTYQCGWMGKHCNGKGTSSLGARDVINFGYGLLDTNIQAQDVLTAAIHSGYPFTGTGCFASPNYMALPAGTCTGANLNVSISPVGVLRGEGGGAQSLSKSGGRTPGGGWSAGGEYVLYLTGVTVSS